MTRIITVGIDAGSDSIKATTTGEPMIMQNIICLGLARTIGPDNDRKMPEDALDLEIRSENLPGGGGHWFVGRLATLPQYAQFAAEMDGTEPKHESPQIHVMIIGMLARLALEYLAPGENGITYHVVASLPVKDWAENYKAFERRLRGTYTVDFRTTPRARRRKITINLQRVRVLPEGLSAVYNQVYSNQLEVVDEEAEQGTIGVVDLGGMTGDLPVVEAMVYDSDRSAGAVLGCNPYLDLIRDAVQSRFGDSDLLSNRAQLVAALKARKGKAVMVSQAGQDCDITDIVERFSNLYAAKVAALIRKHWAKNAEIRRLRVVGGGALLIRPFLEAHLNPEGSSRTYQVSWPDDPQFQNALGNWKCARLLFEGE